MFENDVSKPTKTFIITVLLIFPMSQSAIDIYLPSLPSMTSYFLTSNQYLQMSLTVYMLALGVAQLIYGPCSDKYGRKPVALIAISISIISTFACLYAQSIFQFLLCRLFQGFGMGCGFVIGSAMLGETFKGKELAKMTTASTSIYALSPLILPVLGGYFEEMGGWKWNFSFILMFTAVLLIMVYAFVGETNRNKDSSALNIKQLLINYKRVLLNPVFVGYILCSISGYGITIAFNVVGPFLLQNNFHVSAVFSGYILLLMGLAYFIGTLINQKLLNVLTADNAILCGLLFMTLFSVLMIIAFYLHMQSLTAILILTFLIIAATGTIFSNCFAKALEIFPDKLGVASALIGTGGLFGVSLISWGISYIHSYDMLLLGVIFALESVYGLFSFIFIMQARKSRLCQ